MRTLLTYTNISDYTITFSLILVFEARLFKNSLTDAIANINSIFTKVVQLVVAIGAFGRVTKKVRAKIRESSFLKM